MSATGLSAFAPGRRSISGEAILRGGAIIVISAIIFFPVYWMVLSSLRSSSESLSFPPPLLPHGIDLSAYAQLFTDKPIAHWLLLSTFVATLTVIATLLLVIPAAYALSRLYWAGRSAFGLLLLFTQMMPAAVVVAPVLALYRNLGWTDNLWALALLHTAFVVPLCAWVLKTSFDAVPKEIVEAALIDGCNRWKVLWLVVLPLTRPGLVAVSVIAFFASWNEYLFASTLITKSDLYTASLGLATLMTQLDTPLFVLMAAGVTFSVLPVFFYMAIQRHLLRGLTAGAVKG
ncbi:carbohydrate ABC transporter permease [Kaistia dalseonensis]|uniref:Maltose/maltodextrin transport system permease protein MalG n=1 Tax=Kaistia dalseonensis TaxID=410840 RepID=A0ABU0H583_9HYPH|nr:carbohydrate ABC transporter permease [Kaistia dalseonensis]MCX5494053.1 carbohydrate ABC transporter permease [Kaistia dalseonensis]MDQ0436631.1 multiple sugar transport system permease protein [Kaistia dalseonensis]